MNPLVSKLQNILDQAVESGEETGLQLAVCQNGELICDLYAGWTSAEHKRKVDADTLFPVFSVGKGLVTTLLHILHEEGKLDYDAFVSDYWPEFAVNGKKDTKIWHVMSHRAGLYDLPPNISGPDSFDWNKMVSALQNASPLDTIGGMHHYHALTYGVLAGHIAELVSGMSFRRLLSEKILAPLKINTVYFGINDSLFDTHAFLDLSLFPDTWLNLYNTKTAMFGLNPAANGCMNARALAQFYSSLTADGFHGKHLLNSATIQNATQICRAENDPVLPDTWDVFGLGYVLSGDDKNPVRFFGHGGACGSEGFADKETSLAVGFTKSKLCDNRHTRERISEALGIPTRIW